MGKKFSVMALTIVAFGFGLAPRTNAGTEMIIDNSAQAPPPRRMYHYAPPPRVVYYPPPPVRVAVYPRIGCYAPPYRVYTYNRFGGRRGFHRSHHWR